MLVNFYKCDISLMLAFASDIHNLLFAFFFFVCFVWCSVYSFVSFISVSCIPFVRIFYSSPKFIDYIFQARSTKIICVRLSKINRLKRKSCLQIASIQHHTISLKIHLKKTDVIWWNNIENEKEFHQTWSFYIQTYKKSSFCYPLHVFHCIFWAHFFFR